MNQSLKHLLAVKSLSQYTNKWLMFKRFMKAHSLGRRLPASSYAISLYVTYLHKLGYVTSTINLHLSAISYKHKLFGVHKDLLPTKSFRVKQLLKSFKKSEHDAPRRKPIGKLMLSAIIDSVHRSHISTYNKALYSAAFTLLYHAALRSGEICYTSYANHSLHFSHIRIKGSDDRYLKVKLPSYKHSISKPTPILVKATHNNICPVHHLKNLQSIVG